jgi:hypothetical protein
MTAFRLYLVLLLVVLVAYTAVTIAGHGWNLFPAFFGDMARLGWPGQFNLDFMMMLSLSALWVAWRHGFDTPGLGLAVLAFLGGALFLAVYLLVQGRRTGGDVHRLLVGDERAASSG